MREPPVTGKHEVIYYESYSRGTSGDESRRKNEQDDSRRSGILAGRLNFLSLQNGVRYRYH